MVRVDGVPAHGLIVVVVFLPGSSGVVAQSSMACVGTQMRAEKNKVVMKSVFFAVRYLLCIDGLPV